MANSKLIVEEVKSHEEEEITICWTLPNFIHLAENSGDFIAEKTFSVGGKLSSPPTNWKLSLDHDCLGVGIALEFLGPGSASAKWNVAIRSQTGEYITIRNTRDVKFHKHCTTDLEMESGEIYGFTKLPTLENLLQESLINGELHLKIEIRICLTPLLTEGMNMKRELSQDLKTLLNSGAEADTTFIFVNEKDSHNVPKEIKAHRAILAARSSAFACLFESGDAETTNIEIHKMTAQSFEILLNFIYSGEVDSEWGSFAEKLLYGAAKYELTGLQKYLDENVATVLTPRNVRNILKLADRYNFPKAKEAAKKFVEENPLACLETQVDNIYYNNSLN